MTYCSVPKGAATGWPMEKYVERNAAARRVLEMRRGCCHSHSEHWQEAIYHRSCAGNGHDECRLG